MKCRGLAGDLLQRCVAAQRGGADFPTVWHDILEGHPLVAGVPVQRLESGEAVLDVRLITGQRLVDDSKGYTIA